MPRLQAARRSTAECEPRDHGHFDMLAAGYKYLRTFTPAVIAALPLTGITASPDVAALLDAVDVLRELNAAGRTAEQIPAEGEALAQAVAARSRLIVANPLPARRSAAHPAHPNPADHRPLERTAPALRVNEIRAHHGQPADRQAESPDRTAPNVPAGSLAYGPHGGRNRT
jgi:hypothetical protein